MVFLARGATAEAVTTANAFDHLAEARGKENGYSAAADSFCAGCLAAGRAAAARTAAFLRRKYASRRLRLIRTWCCCPMESYGLKIAETQSALKPIVLLSS